MINIHETVLPIIRKTRAITLPQYGNVEVICNKSEFATDAVTQIDRDVEKFLKTELQYVYADIEFVGEEFGGNRDAKTFWLCDPIDGTENYIRGLPFCTTMLALIDDGAVVFGAIYDFVNDDLYWAEKGKGAYKNNEPIRVSNRDMKCAFVANELRSTTPEQVELYQRVYNSGLMVPKIVAAGYEFVQVAKGTWDARIHCEPWGKDFDFAPGIILIQEAGGIVANIGTHDFNYKNRNFIAANPVLYKQLTEGDDPLFPIKKTI